MEPFRFKQFTVEHSRSPMHIGTDAVTLGVLAPVGGRVLDVGCGCGIIGLMLAQRGAQSITMVDIDPEAAAEARANAQASPWANRIEIACADFLKFNPAESFDCIVSNPPFFGPGLAAPDRRRAAARSEAALPAEAFMQKAAALMAPGATLSVVIPTDRQEAWRTAAAFAGLSVRQIIEIKTKASATHKRAVITFTNSAATAELSTLLLNSDDYKRLTSPFYL